MISIDIIIKAPNQKLEDQTFGCDLEWTVLDLKTHLSREYPSKPRIEDQRLIYSGHLLKNEQSLRDVLQPIEENLTFTIHMVCSQSSISTPKRNSQTMAANNNNINNNPNNTSNTNTNPSTPPTNENNSRNTTNTNGFQYPNNGQYFSNFNAIYANPLNIQSPNVVIPPDQMWQQMAIFQQTYAQYMAQYLQNPYLNPNQITPTVIPPMAVPMAPMGAPQQIINAVPEAGIPAVNPVVPQPPAVQRLNAGPGGQQVMDDEEEGRNRDWLDCFYWMSRAIVLFSIIYFYSSFTRFLLVVFLSVVLYLYQTNWFNNRRQQPINNNNNGLQQNVVNNNNNNNNGVNREEEPNEVPETEVLDRPQRMANNSDDGRVTEERFSGIRFVWVIVSSLFTSLIPENPAVPVN